MCRENPHYVFRWFGYQTCLSSHAPRCRSRRRVATGHAMPLSREDCWWPAVPQTPLVSWLSTGWTVASPRHIPIFSWGSSPSSLMWPYTILLSTSSPHPWRSAPSVPMFRWCWCRDRRSRVSSLSAPSKDSTSHAHSTSLSNTIYLYNASRLQCQFR